MASTPIEIPKLPEGLTLTVDIFPRGIDTPFEVGIVLTEAINRDGTYSGVVSSAATGLVTVKVIQGDVVIAEVTDNIENTTQKFILEDGDRIIDAIPPAPEIPPTPEIPEGSDAANFAVAKQAYFDNADFREVNSRTKARKFVTACTRLLFIPATFEHGDEKAQFDLRTLNTQRVSAQSWLSSPTRQIGYFEFCRDEPALNSPSTRS